MKTPHPLPQALLGAFLLFTLGATGFSAAPPVESPVGEFGFDAPGEPPSGPPLITPMAYLNGPYNDSFYFPGSTTFMTMDASGKVLAVSSIPGFADKKEGASVTRTLFVRTVNGIPTLTANAKAGGMYDDGSMDAPTDGSGKALLPLGGPVDPAQGGVQQVTVMSSFSGKRDRKADKDPVQMDTLDLDVNQLGGVVNKNWGINLLISERMSTRGNFYVADLFFTNPDGTQTYFGERKVVYSATNGYSISFSKGVLSDSLGNPILDTKGKQVVDKYSSFKFSKLLFKKRFDASNNNAVFWEPAAGGIFYKFLGQSGFGQVFNFDITLF
jgi:hypothetical protein